MTEAEVRAKLEAGEHVFYSAWCYSSGWMSCGDGCCDDSLEDVDNAMQTIERMCGGKWEEVHD